MKKYAKILSILLCLSMLVGMIAMVATADTTEEKTVTLVASELGLENAADFTTATIDEITFTGDAGTNELNSPKYYANGTALRFYGANTFTVSVAEGYEIVSITITAESNYIRESHSALTNATAEGMDTNEVVLTPVDGTADVVVTNPNTSGNFRVGTCSVTYKAVASEEPTEPEATEPSTEGPTRLEIVSPKRLTTVFGKYTDGTGADESTFVDGEDGYCVTDGWYGRAGYAECDDIDGLVALVMDIDSAIKFGGIEIVAHDSNGEGSGDIYTFAVQALVDGAWVEVASEEEYLFDATRAYTASFDAVETSKVRILIPAYWDGEARIREVSLFEVKAGTPKTYVDLSDIIDGDGDKGNNGALVDGNKASVFAGSNITVNLTKDGQPSVISGFELYLYRGQGGGVANIAKNATISIKKTADGEFEEIGTFATNWVVSGDVQDSLFADFDQAYAAYELKLTLDAYGYANEFAVYQYEGAVAPEQPTEPEETTPVVRDPSEAVTGVLPTPDAGYYDGEGNFVSAHFSNATYGNPANMVDGNREGYQYASFDFTPAENLKQNGGDLVPAIIFNMNDEPVTLNGLNIWSYTGKTWFIDFHVEVKTSADGEWENVGTYKDVNNEANGYHIAGDEYLYYFDKTVTAYALQIVIDNFEGKESANVYQIYEIIPMIVEITEPEQPEDPTVPSEPEQPEDPTVPSEPEQPTYLDTVAPDRLDTVLGHYTDNVGDDESTFVDGGEGANLTDGSLDTVGSANCTYGDGLVAAIINVDGTIKFGGIEFAAYDINGEGAGDLIDFVVQAWVDGEWVELLHVTEWPHADGRIVTYEFETAVETAKVRVLINDYYDGELQLKEITLFEEKVGEPEQPEDPTDPSVPEETDPTEPSVPEDTTPRDGSSLQYMALPAPQFGYYDADNNFTSFDYGSWVASNITDGNLFTLGCSDYYVPSELVQNGGTKTPVVIFDMKDAPITMNGIEYVTNWNEHCFATSVIIQVKTSADGEWETVFEAEGLNFNDNHTKNFYFDTVTAYAMQIVIPSFDYYTAEESEDGKGNERLAIQEITPWVVGGPVLNQIKVDSATSGVYVDGMEWSELTRGSMAADAIDWDKNSTVFIDGEEGDEWPFATDLFSGNGGHITPAILLWMEEAQVITRVEVYPQRDGRVYNATNLIIQAMDEYGEWYTIGEYENSDWDGPAVIEFPAVLTNEIRVLAVACARADGEAAAWHCNEIALYGAEGAVPGETPEDPTEPTEPSETPTEPSETPTEPSETPTEPSETPTEPSTPAEDKTATQVDALEDGNKIVIYFNNGNAVIGNTFADGNKKLNASDAVVADGKLTFTDGALVLTVAVNEEGQITFQTEDGKYLTSGATGNSVALTDEATEYSLWVLEETEGGFLVKNVNAAYNGNAQYLEYYNGFTTYGISATSNLANYTFNFFVLDEPTVEDPTDPSEPEKPTDPEGSGKTGDVTLSVLVGLLAISAIGCGIVISKKKEF